jgi:hypothetical protein
MPGTLEVAFSRRVFNAFMGVSVLLLGLAAPAASQTATRSPWSLNFGANEIYDSNVRFSSNQAQEDWATLLQVSGGGGWAPSRKASVNFTGNTTQSLYTNASDLNNLSYGVGLGLTYLFSRRLSWTLSDTLTSGYAQDSRLLTDAGLLLPKVVTRTNAFASTLGYDLSARTHVRWLFSQQRVLFDSQQLTSGWSFSTGVNLSRQVSRSQTLSVSYDYGQQVSEGSTGVVQAVLGIWQMTAGKSVTLSASGGVRPYTLPGESGFRFAPAGAAQLSVRTRANDSLLISYETAVGQALGNTSTYLTRGIITSYRWGLSRKMNVDGSGSYVRGTYPQIADQLLLSRTATIAVGYLVARSLTLAFNSSVYRRDETPGPGPVSAYRAGVSLTYGKTWH